MKRRSTRALTKKAPKKVYVLGAGMSGLSTALRLAELGVDTTIIEREHRVGGLAGSFAWHEFKNLDYGPHIYHTPDKQLEKIWKKEYGDLFHQNEFWGKNVKGQKFDQYFDYPLSFASLKKFPGETRNKILNELAHLDEERKAKAKSYAEYVRELVGPTLMEYFFIRYPQKLWGVSIDEMTANWAPKRVHFRTKDEHFHAGQWSAVGKFGSGKIVERMTERYKKAGGKLILGTSVTAMEHSKGLIHKIVLGKKKVAVGSSDNVISTIPIPVMAEYLGVRNKLKYRGAKLVFVALKKNAAIPDKFNFLYYDAPEIIFHRVSEQKKFCALGFPKDKTVLSCEIAYTKGDALDTADGKEITVRVVKDLIQVGLVKKEEVIDTVIVSLPRYDDLHVLHIRGTDLAERLASDDGEEERELIKDDTTFRFNRSVVLGKHAVAKDNPAFIIAEAGLNHNGSLRLALELVDKAAEAGCNAVKFQTYRAENRVSRAVKGNRYAEELIDLEETTYDMLHRLELSRREHEKLFAYAKEKGIEMFSTPFDLQSVDLLERLGVSFYKISSMDLVNLPLIKKVAGTGKPLIVSTGMSTLGQIEDAVNVVRDTGNENLILLHCISSYPAAPQDMNVVVMDTLRKAFGVPVGLSDHSIGLSVASVALALGAEVIERHFTLDRFMEGPDHILSSDPEEMKELVRLSHLIPVIKGSSEKVILGSERETINRFKKCLYAAIDIPAGKKITERMIAVKGPGGGILPKYLDVVVGKTAKAYIQKDRAIEWRHI
ncbi:MAG: N-acetylneuraminate synthase [Candidatus Kaiserbacteria bacterium GW2011_GWA2_58_9]|uniref:N-acetylneuraminate synthase n=1 Tax=Candidatus Kaiserbacteria bacterium GW2011_GWA2_58_9 TaxID=1618672 RepID=A0A0G1YVH3_9BACT|nr:MAG: N-acetylneuraminate synthase [Candidatus Kaiserbacteria bacterium GW2011_GWA2_58_9]